jgi:Flp pilus assembly protein TadB
MSDWILAGVGVALLLTFLWAQRRWHSRQIALSRIPMVGDRVVVRVLRVGQVEGLWIRAMPWVMGIASSLAFLLFTRMGATFSLSLGFLFFVVGILIRSTVVGRRILNLESQLSEAIDHIVTSLHAGVGVLDARTSAEHQARKLLKPYLSTLVSRIRLGDDPVEVCKDLAQLLPLESFRLFYYALAVQWEGGGNLAPTLATTGRFIRDRVEVGRRVRAHTTEARFSVIAVLGLTYFLAALMWQLSPDRVEGFVTTDIGRNVASGAIVLQGLGAVWTARMSRIQF